MYSAHQSDGLSLFRHVFKMAEQRKKLRLGELRMIIYGFVLLLLVFWLPKGVTPLIDLILRRPKRSPADVGANATTTVQDAPTATDFPQSADRTVNSDVTCGLTWSASVPVFVTVNGCDGETDPIGVSVVGCLCQPGADFACVHRCLHRCEISDRPRS